MRKVILLSFVVAFCACGVPNVKYEEKEKEVEVLKKEVENLNKELEGYKTTPDRLLADAKTSFAKRDQKNMGAIYNKVAKYHPGKPEAKQIANLKARLDKLVSDSIAKDNKRAVELATRKEYARVTTIADGYDLKHVNLWSSTDGSSRRVVGSCSNNERVEVINKSYPYVLVRKSNGVEGYFMEEFLK